MFFLKKRIFFYFLIQCNLLFSSGIVEHRSLTDLSGDVVNEKAENRAKVFYDFAMYDFSRNDYQSSLSSCANALEICEKDDLHSKLSGDIKRLMIELYIKKQSRLSAAIFSREQAEKEIEYSIKNPQSKRFTVPLAEDFFYRAGKEYSILNDRRLAAESFAKLGAIQEGLLESVKAGRSFAMAADSLLVADKVASLLQYERAIILFMKGNDWFSAFDSQKSIFNIQKRTVIDCTGSLADHCCCFRRTRGAFNKMKEIHNKVRGVHQRVVPALFDDLNSSKLELANLINLITVRELEKRGLEKDKILEDKELKELYVEELRLRDSVFSDLKFIINHSRNHPDEILIYGKRAVCQIEKLSALYDFFGRLDDDRRVHFDLIEILDDVSKAQIELCTRSSDEPNIKIEKLKVNVYKKIAEIDRRRGNSFSETICLRHISKTLGLMGDFFLKYCWHDREAIKYYEQEEKADKRSEKVAIDMSKEMEDCQHEPETSTAPFEKALILLNFRRYKELIEHHKKYPDIKLTSSVDELGERVVKISGENLDMTENKSDCTDSLEKVVAADQKIKIAYEKVRNVGSSFRRALSLSEMFKLRQTNKQEEVREAFDQNDPFLTIKLVTDFKKMGAFSTLFYRMALHKLKFPGRRIIAKAFEQKASALSEVGDRDYAEYYKKRALFLRSPDQTKNLGEFQIDLSGETVDEIRHILDGSSDVHLMSAVKS